MKSLLLPALLLAAAVSAGCGHAVSPSHVSGNYRAKLHDDVLFEASTTTLVTTRDVVIALDCRPLMVAVIRNDAATIDRFVGRGLAARLPAGVSLYTPPFSASNPKSLPIVVTDDRHAGRLCTPHAFKVLKS